jgi:hypothetical protein
MDYRLSPRVRVVAMVRSLLLRLVKVLPSQVEYSAGCVSCSGWMPMIDSVALSLSTLMARSLLLLCTS